MKRLMLALALMAALAVLMAQGKKRDDLDPLKVAADTHKVAFENKFVRVLEVRIPPGKTEPMHRHPHGLSIYFNDWDAEVTVQGKAKQSGHRKVGTFAWHEAAVHEVRNASATEAHVLRVELKY